MTTEDDSDELSLTSHVTSINRKESHENNNQQIEEDQKTFAYLSFRIVLVTLTCDSQMCDLVYLNFFERLLLPIKKRFAAIHKDF